MLFCAVCALRTASTPAGARSLYVRVTASPSNALNALSQKVQQEGLERMLKARKTFAKPSVLRQRNVSDALYYKAKQERVKLVEELVLQKNFFPCASVRFSRSLKAGPRSVAGLGHKCRSKQPSPRGRTPHQGGH